MNNRHHYTGDPGEHPEISYQAIMETAYGIAALALDPLEEPAKERDAYWLLEYDNEQERWTPTAAARIAGPAVRATAEMLRVAGELEKIGANGIDLDTIAKPGDPLEETVSSAIAVQVAREIEELHGAARILAATARGIAAGIARRAATPEREEEHAH